MIRTKQMEFKEVVAKRKSVREFKKDTIGKEVIADIIMEAGRAPSWVNAQEWKVFVATGHTLENIRNEFVRLSKEGVKGYADFDTTHRTEWSEQAQKNMNSFYEYANSMHVGQHWDELENSFFDAPAVLFLCLPRTANKWAVLDLGGFEQTMLLAATNRGLGSIPAYNIVKYPDVIRKYIDISDEYDIAVGVAIGYVADTPINRIQSSRMTLDQFVIWKD